MRFIPMDPDVARAAIEGYQDELSSEQRKLDSFYRQHRCRRCGGTFQKEIDAHHAFSDASSPLARCLLRCIACRHLFDPFSNLDVELGNPLQVPPEIPIIDPTKKG